MPVLDLESSGGLGVRKLKTWAKAWVARVDGQLGVKPIIYTSPSFWKTHMGRPRGSRTMATGCGSRTGPLRIAPAMPAANWGGHGWTIWQYSSRGSVDGINGYVDLDRYAGTDLGALRIKNNR